MCLYPPYETGLKQEIFMITKPLITLTEADLRRLIDERVPESKQIEYKRELPDGSDKGTVSFLRAVTAFANTQGGDLLYGIEAKEGIPIRLSPLTMASSDQVVQRFESLCRDGMEPRLTGVQYHFVPLDGGGSVLVVRIPKSWSAPHRVSAGNHAHFYGRNSAGAYQLDVAELRQAFTLSDTVVERIRSFRANRLLALGSDEAPLRLKEGALVVLHVIPLQAMVSDFRIDIASNSNALQKIYPLGASGWNQRINLDGRLSFRSISDGRSHGYAQLFRNGIIEAVIVEELWNGKKIMDGQAYEKNIISALRSYFAALDELGIASPAYLFLSLLGVRDWTLGVNASWFRNVENNRAERDNILLPEIAVEQWTDDPEIIMRPAFDMVWNVFGFAQSFNYNDAGQWVGQRS
jgi:Putative DNA-binding domain